MVENKFLGVPGGWDVELMIVMNAPIAKWEKKLPVKTQQYLNKSREGELFDDPCCRIFQFPGCLWDDLLSY